MMTRAEMMLVLFAQQGDREALNRLLEQFQTRLFRYVRGLLGNDASSAEDVLQETLLRIARKLTWLTEPQAFEAWAYRIASNETYRVLGRSKAQIATEQLDDDMPATEAVSLRLTGEELGRMIVDLSPASRAVVLLHYQEERPLDEIASVLAIPLGTVKSRLAYGLKCLREKTRQ
jgi:RNA polymerase sigma-70 factor (ECF subfamily)